MATGEKLGFECKAYYNTGTDAAPTWVEMKRVQDATIPMEKDEAEVSRRESKFKYYRGAMLDLGIEFGYLHRAGTDAVLAALRDSYLNGTPIQFAVMDDDITTSGAQGLRAFMEVFSYPNNQNLGDGVTVDIAAKPTPVEEAAALVEPTWYIVP